MGEHEPKHNPRVAEPGPPLPQSRGEAIPKRSRIVLGGCWDLNGLEGTLGDLNGRMCLKIGLLLLFLE